jgi:hypothetical protein
VAYGGYIFTRIPDLRRRIPGHYLGDELSQVPELVERLMIDRPPTPTADRATADYEAAWLSFRERAGLIEADMWQFTSLSQNGRGPALPNATGYLTQNILSALKLGDLEYVRPNLHWVEGMLAANEASPQALHKFLAAYREVADRHLSGTPGRLVVDWLAAAVV